VTPNAISEKAIEADVDEDEYERGRDRLDAGALLQVAAMRGEHSHVIAIGRACQSHTWQCLKNSQFRRKVTLPLE
jgi:hypothetical protein